MSIRSPGEPVLAQVGGHSEHGDAYRRITYDRDGKTVLHNRASFRRLSLPHAPSPPRVYGGCAVPQGGVGDRHLVTIPQGVVGDRLPWGGERQGGGGRSLGGRTVRCARAVHALCEKLAVLHHREFGKFRRLEGCH